MLHRLKEEVRRRHRMRRYSPMSWMEGLAFQVLESKDGSRKRGDVRSGAGNGSRHRHGDGERSGTRGRDERVDHEDGISSREQNGG